MMLQSTRLKAHSGIRHAFFTREGGVSRGLYGSLNGGIGSKDDPADVTENRRRMAEALKVEPTHLVSAYQIHSPDVAVVGPDWVPGTRPRADAFVTRTPGFAIAVGAADCTPVLFADADAGVIGAAHAGWKGAFTGVLESTVAAMEQLGARRARIAAAIGPTIRQPSYEVGPEFVARFTDADAGNSRFFAPSKKESHAMFDIAGYVKMRLAGAGIAAVDDLGVDTYADEARCFSYRRSVHRGEPDYGRLINAIALDG